jgi:2',3'-cyclic-nucleotide 2'-phosphodiesterase (5'-nucleotidase family)
MERGDLGTACFNLTPEQEVKFNDIFEETKKLYPHLVADDIGIMRVRVLIAHSILTNDAKIELPEKNEIEVKEQVEEEIYNDNRVFVEQRQDGEIKI